MNSSVINAKLFNNVFTRWWENWKKEKERYTDINVWWDLGKKKIKELCQWVSRKLSREKKERLQYIENKICEIESKPDHRDKSEIHDLKNELSDLYKSKGIGAKIRSRIRWFEEGGTII